MSHQGSAHIGPRSSGSSGAPAPEVAPASSPARTLWTRRSVLAAGLAGAAAAACACAPTPAYAGGLFGVDIDGVKGLASQLRQTLNQVMDAVKQMDFDTASARASQALADAEALRDEVSGGLWPVLENLPFVGGDVHAARMLAQVATEVVADVLVPLTEALRDVDLGSLLTPVDVAAEEESSAIGRFRVDLAAIGRLAQVVSAAAASAESASDALVGAGKPGTDMLAEALDQTRALLDEALPLLRACSEVLSALPGMLGGEGRRVYAVIAQNNVEIRSTGGLAGQMAPIVAENGTIEIGEVGSYSRYMGVWRGAPVWEPREDDLPLYYPTYAELPCNTNLSPDFPRVCEIWCEMWRLTNGEPLDGVLAIDPPVLQMLLGLTGGAYLPDGTLIDGTNAVRILQHDVYMQHLGDGQGQDAAFAEAAQAALGSVMGGLADVDLAGLADVCARACDEGRLLLWFADPALQELADGLGVSGALVLDPAEPVLGVYLNNASWSKFEWWLDATLEVDGVVWGAGSQAGAEDQASGEDQASAGDRLGGSGGATTHSCRLTLASIATEDDLPVLLNAVDIVGTNPDKWATDDILQGVMLYAPAGGSLHIESSQNCEQFEDFSHKGLEGHWFYAHVLTGSPAVVQFTVTVPAGAKAPLAVRMSPTVQDYR